MVQRRLMPWLNRSKNNDHFKIKEFDTYLFDLRHDVASWGTVVVEGN